MLPTTADVTFHHHHRHWFLLACTNVCQYAYETTGKLIWDYYHVFTNNFMRCRLDELDVACTCSGGPQAGKPNEDMVSTMVMSEHRKDDTTPPLMWQT